MYSLRTILAVVAASALSELGNALPTEASIVGTFNTSTTIGTGQVRELLPEAPVQISPHPGAYARVSRMKDNSLIAGYVNFDRINGEPWKILRTSISRDWGRSWQELGEVYRAPERTAELDNAFPLELPWNGRVLFAYRFHDRAPDGSISKFRISISTSTNGGRHFDPWSDVDVRDHNGVNGLWEPFLRIANDQRTIQCYYSAEVDSGKQQSFMKESTDDGKTWSGPILVSNDQSRDGMLGVAPLNRPNGLM
jgi:hypothetical protein